MLVIVLKHLLFKCQGAFWDDCKLKMLSVTFSYCHISILILFFCREQRWVDYNWRGHGESCPQIAFLHRKSRSTVPFKQSPHRNDQNPSHQFLQDFIFWVFNIGLPFEICTPFKLRNIKHDLQMSKVSGLDSSAQFSQIPYISYFKILDTL